MQGNVFQEYVCGVTLHWKMIKCIRDECKNFNRIQLSRVTLYTAGHLHTAVPYCSHSRAPIVHTAVPRENNEHGCVYLRCRAVCKLPGCVEGHPWIYEQYRFTVNVQDTRGVQLCIFASCVAYHPKR